MIAEYRPWHLLLRWHLLLAREERIEKQGSVFSLCPLGWSFPTQFLTAISRDVTLNVYSWCNTYHLHLTSNLVTLFTSSNCLIQEFNGRFTF